MVSVIGLFWRGVDVDGPIQELKAGDIPQEGIHLETSEIEVSRPSAEREMCILEYLKKKDAAEEGENPETEIMAWNQARGNKSSGDG